MLVTGFECMFRTLETGIYHSKLRRTPVSEGAVSCLNRGILLRNYIIVVDVERSKYLQIMGESKSSSTTRASEGRLMSLTTIFFRLT